MIYRPLTSADLDAYRELEGYAFRSNPDRNNLAPEQVGRLRGLFVAGELAAQLQLIPLQLQTGRGAATAVGVGSVASAPQTRRRGHVEQLMRESCAEMLASGAAFCVLFPFKRSFYGRYGWATFLERRVYSGAPALFAPFRAGSGRFVPAGAADIPELDTIYRGALRWRFGPIVRDEAWWSREVLSDWERRRHYAYIWRDETGQGRAYLVYRFAGESERPEGAILVREIVALDPTARGQLFAFLAGHDGQVAQVEFRAPADAPVNLLLPDPLECRVEPYFMLRILDVPAALEALHYAPELAGQLTLAVSDDWMPANRGVYRLELARGRAAVERLPDDTPAAVYCDIHVLAQLASRYLRPRTAAAFGAIVAERPALDLLDRAMAGLAPFCSDFF